MRRELTYKYIAFDGTEFTGHDALTECGNYELGKIKDCEERMKNHLDIHNPEFLLGVNNQECFIRFRTTEARSMFVEWCKFNEIRMMYHDIIYKVNDVWYRIIGNDNDNKRTFKINDMSIDDEMNAIIETRNSLYNMDCKTINMNKENNL